MLVHYGWARPLDRLRQKVEIWEKVSRHKFKDSKTPILQRLKASRQRPFSQHPEVVKRLASQLLSFFQDLGNQPLSPSAP
mmetsp:Transcript_33045/g.51512  ORF Transcript_33045/g.51512 Transcript_33045/m.51512 type:complete len:80 (-) Transcript_33045:61-300(-)